MQPIHMMGAGQVAKQCSDPMTTPDHGTDKDDDAE